MIICTGSVNHARVFNLPFTFGVTHFAAGIK